MKLERNRYFQKNFDMFCFEKVRNLQRYFVLEYYESRKKFRDRLYSDLQLWGRAWGREHRWLCSQRQAAAGQPGHAPGSAGHLRRPDRTILLFGSGSHVFGPPGSGSSSSSIFKKILAKNYIFGLKMMCLWQVMRKNMKKKFFCILKISEERSRIQIRIRNRVQKSEVWTTDPGIRIRIRTKMSRIPALIRMSWDGNHKE